ncbi:MAG: hypothetical protein VKK05_09240, partial [Synechococcus sp.]|nr:hypothetical protein [Synechococcus sp.]
ITGDVQRHIVCTVSGGRAAVVAEEPEAPLVRITLDTEAFLVLATGRLDPEALGSRIHHKGNSVVFSKLINGLNMMI